MTPMTPERWQRINQLFHAALEREPKQRQAFLAEACTSDEALAHEVESLRLVDQRDVHWQNRAHFFAIAAQLMRRILVDHVRKRNYQKRGGEARRVTLDEGLIISDERAADVALDDALNSLADIDQRKSQIVELRFFAGLSIEETVEVLAVSPGTVMRDWTLAKAWLRREIASL
jgi:RNA polymerase sigma-70 factor, ECF subfamily